MRRTLTRWLPAALAPLLIATAGCGAGDTTNTLTIWHAWGGAELTALKGLIAQYREAYPAMEVIALQVPHDKLKDKYLRSSAANGGPDLLIGDADWSGKFAPADLVVPVEEMFSADELARFHPKAIASLRLKGKLYALPESRETVALYYNKRLLKTPPKSVPEMLETAAKLEGVQYGMVFNTDFYYGLGYFFGSGMTFFDRDMKLTINSPGTLETLKWYEQLPSAKGVLANHEYLKADSLYKEGQTAMIINGPWALVDYQKKLGSDLGLATLPTLANGKPAASWVGVKCLMFNTNSDPRHRQFAKDFAMFMTSPESQLFLSEQAGHIPAVNGVKIPETSPLAVFQAQADVGTPASIDPEVSLVWEPMNKAIRQVLQKESAPESALAEAETVIKAKLDAMRSQAK